jgi:hypothetical protein
MVLEAPEIKDFKYDCSFISNTDPKEILRLVHKLLCYENNPIEALMIIEKYYQYLDTQHHVDNAISLLKEKIKELE